MSDARDPLARLEAAVDALDVEEVMSGRVPITEGPVGQAFLSFAEAANLDDAPDIQFIEMRRAWYAGAGAVFAYITTGLTPGDEPNDDDLARMSMLDDELKFALAYFLEMGKPEPS